MTIPTTSAPPMDWQPVTDHASELGESPFWHPLEQCLYYIDIAGRQVLRVVPGQGAQPEIWDLPSEPGCIAPVRGGGLVIALRDGIYRARQWGGTLECLVRFHYDTTRIRFNDGQCDSRGRLWAGTVYEPRDDGRRGAELYCIDMRGGSPVVTLRAQNAITANGVNWSLDDRILWWSDTPNHIIHSWDFEPATGVMRAHRVFHQFPGKPEGWNADLPDAAARYGGRPDGSAVDSAGIYHCSMYEGGRILSFRADGTAVGEMAVPVRCPTMPCFGGTDLRTLFVTTGRKGRSERELAATPWAGRVLSRPVAVAGRPVGFFDCGEGG